MDSTCGFNRILTLVKLILIFATQPAQLQIWSKESEKSIETRECSDENIDATISLRWCLELYLNSGAMFDAHTLHFSSETTVFLFLMILVSGKHCQLFKCLYESKDFESYLPLCLYGIRSRSWKDLSIVVATLQGITNRDAIWIHVFSRRLHPFHDSIALLGRFYLVRCLPIDVSSHASF